MKNINFIFNIVLTVAVIVLFLLYFNQKSISTSPLKKVNDSSVVNTQSVSSGDFNIAYVNVDTLLNNYKLYNDLQNQLAAKQKQMEATVNQKTVQLQKDAAAFQQKVQTNSFLSVESAQQQEQELYQKQQDLMDFKDKLSNDLVLESQKMQKQLLDTVTNLLKEYNVNFGYTFIFNSGSFLYNNPSYNITDTITTLLNKRYNQTSKHSQ